MRGLSASREKGGKAVAWRVGRRRSLADQPASHWGSTDKAFFPLQRGKATTSRGKFFFWRHETTQASQVLTTTPCDGAVGFVSCHTTSHLSFMRTLFVHALAVALVSFAAYVPPPPRTFSDNDCLCWSCFSSALVRVSDPT